MHSYISKLLSWRMSWNQYPFPIVLEGDMHQDINSDWSALECGCYLKPLLTEQYMNFNAVIGLREWFFKNKLFNEINLFFHLQMICEQIQSLKYILRTFIWLVSYCFSLWTDHNCLKFKLCCLFVTVESITWHGFLFLFVSIQLLLVLILTWANLRSGLCKYLCMQNWHSCSGSILTC